MFKKIIDMFILLLMTLVFITITWCNITKTNIPFLDNIKIEQFNLK